MNQSFFSLLSTASLALAAGSSPINTDSVFAITSDGQRAHTISATMLNGTERILLTNPDGALCLLSSSYDKKWFTSKNPSWTAKSKMCETLVCQVATQKCKCDDSLFSDGLKFFDFMENGKEGVIFMGSKKVKGKFPKRTIPLDSLGNLFR
jgi:hypothetical protein